MRPQPSRRLSACRRRRPSRWVHQTNSTEGEAKRSEADEPGWWRRNPHGSTTPRLLSLLASTRSSRVRHPTRIPVGASHAIGSSSAAATISDGWHAAPLPVCDSSTLAATVPPSTMLCSTRIPNQTSTKHHTSTRPLHRIDWAAAATIKPSVSKSKKKANTRTENNCSQPLQPFEPCPSHTLTCVPVILLKCENARGRRSANHVEWVPNSNR